MPEKKDSPEPNAAGIFATTHWTVVVSATDPDSKISADALAILCRTYWYPLYAYVRRTGKSPHDAEDLTQAFFAHMLAKGTIGRADRERGRFRTFLLTGFKNFLIKEWKKANAQKRGGGQDIVSFDMTDAETRYRLEPVDEATPEQAYEKRWVKTLLERALEALRTEHVARGKEHLFEALKGALPGASGPPHYAAVAAALDMSEGALKMAASRLRARYGELLRNAIAETVAEPQDVDAELRHLMDVLAS